MHQRENILLITLVGILLIFTGCGAASGFLSSSSEESSDNTTDTVVGGNISAVTFSGSESEISLSDIAENDSLILLLFTNSSSSSSSAFQVGSSSLNSYLLDNSEDDADDENLTSDFHEILRNFEADLDDAALIDDSTDAEQSSIKFASKGSEKSFKVLNSFSSSSNYDTVTATLRYQTTYFNFYVDNRNVSDLDDSDLEELAEQFNDVIPAEKELFGEESDINNDDRFTVLFTQTVNELGAAAGGMVTGFFYAADLFDSSSYPISNEMEIFYTFVPDNSGDYGSAVSKSFAMTNIYPGVLPHEYQHMISFNQHYNINESTVETSWLNEALSHLAEDIHSINSQNYMTATGLENPARIRGYLSDISSTCFSCGSNLYQRGGSYLFLRYLYEQAELGNITQLADGADLIGKLLDTSLTSKANIINAVYGDEGTEDQFKDLVGLFGLAVYLSNTGMTSDNRFGFKGINIRSTQDDNRGTILNGPAVHEISDLPFTDTITGSGIHYMQISGADIIKNGYKIDITTSTSSDFGGYVIQE
jgi:hypothetical protein